MKAIRAALAAVRSALSPAKAKLGRLQSRYRRQRQRAYRNHAEQIRTEKAADKARAGGHVAEAARLDKKAARCRHRAEVSHSRAQNLLGRIKPLVQRIHGLETDQAKLLAQAVEWRKSHGVRIRGDKASGGTRRKRLVAVALAAAAACSAGRRPNRYSQGGYWTVRHAISGESSSERSDCSQFVTSVFWSSGCPDPNGASYTGGFTGTLVAHLHQVARSEMQPGDLVIYGPGNGHHVEMFVGPGTKTIGHGSSPVDPGVVDLFGDGDYRIFRAV